MSVLVLAMATAMEPPSAPLLPFEIVDTHVHLMTTTNGIEYTWTKPTPPGACPCRPPCACNMSVPEYAATSAPFAPVSHFVFCEVSANPEDWLKEAKWVQAVADRTDPATDGPKVGAILAHPPPGFGVGPVSAYASRLDEMEALPLVRGVRAYLDANQSVMEDLLLGLKELGRRNMVVDTFVPPITDPRVFDVVSKTPETQYSIEHFGCGCDVNRLVTNATAFAAWKAAVQKLATLPNIPCFNLGGTMAAYPTQADVKAAQIKPMLQVAVDAFGYDRLCFEANWFFSNWKTSPHWDEGFGTWVTVLVQLLQDIGATEDQMRKLFRDNAVKLYRIADEDPAAVGTLLGNGTEASLDGPVSLARTSEPRGLAWRPGGELVISEFGGNRVQNVTRCNVGGYLCSTKSANQECMHAPGRTYSAINNCQCGCDTFYQMGSGHRIRMLAADRSALRTIAGTGIRGYKNGPAAEAEFNHPYGVLVMPDGDRVLIADAANHAIREYSFADDTVRTVVGHSEGMRGCHDAGNTTSAGLNYPTGLALDPVSNSTVFIADRGNNCIRAMEGTALWTVAGDCCSGEWGLKDGVAHEVRFSGPTSITAVVDAASPGGVVLYVTDGGNNAVRVVRIPPRSPRQPATATVAVLRVPTPSRGDSESSASLRLHMPTGIAAAHDPETNHLSLFVSDSLNGRIVRYDLVSHDTANALVAVAGSGQYGYFDGPPPLASFRGPQGLLWDRAGALLVADTLNNRVRTVSAKTARAALDDASPGTGALPLRQALQPAKAAPSSTLHSAGDKIRVMVWTGHSGPYHDHFYNGGVLARALNFSGDFSAWLPCQKDETTPCESAFNAELLKDFDVILVYADTYESPNRGTLTDEEWDALFGFVKRGGGFFALHTASACWDHKVEDSTDPRSVEFHVGLLNAEFGGHSPYKDYVSHVVASGDTKDPITHGLTDYVVSDELYHPIVYNRSRSDIFLTAYDPGQCGPQCENATAIHGLRHTYGEGRVLYFAQGHDMAEFETPGVWEGNHAFGTIIKRSLAWLAKHTS